MPNYTASSAKFPSAQAGLGRQWNVKIQSQPNPVTNHHPHPFQKHKCQSTTFTCIQLFRNMSAKSARSMDGLFSPLGGSQGRRLSVSYFGREFAMTSVRQRENGSEQLLKVHCFDPGPFVIPRTSLRLMRLYRLDSAV